MTAIGNKKKVLVNVVTTLLLVCVSCRENKSSSMTHTYNTVMVEAAKGSSHSNSDRALALTCSPYMALKYLCGWQEVETEALKEGSSRFQTFYSQRSSKVSKKKLSPNDCIVRAGFEAALHSSFLHSGGDGFACFVRKTASFVNVQWTHLLWCVVYGARLWCVYRFHCKPVRVEPPLILTRSPAVLSDEGWCEWVSFSNFQLWIEASWRAEWDSNKVWINI